MVEISLERLADIEQEILCFFRCDPGDITLRWIEEIEPPRGLHERRVIIRDERQEYELWIRRRCALITLEDLCAADDPIKYILQRLFGR